MQLLARRPPSIWCPSSPPLHAAGYAQNGRPDAQLTRLEHLHPPLQGDHLLLPREAVQHHAEVYNLELSQ